MSEYIDPLLKKQELIEQYQKRKPKEIKKFADLGIEFEESTFDYFRNSDEYLESLENENTKLRKTLIKAEYDIGNMEGKPLGKLGSFEYVTIRLDDLLTIRSNLYNAIK